MASGIKWFLSGATLSGAALATVLAVAAPGDLLVRKGGQRVELTAAQASDYADEAIADALCPAGAVKANMLEVRVWREGSDFYGTCVARMPVSPANLEAQGAGPYVVDGVAE